MKERIYDLLASEFLIDDEFRVLVDNDYHYYWFSYPESEEPQLLSLREARRLYKTERRRK